MEKTINAHILDPLNDPDLPELVKTYQVPAHCRTSYKYNKNECRSSNCWYFTEKAIIAKSFLCKFSNYKKQEVLSWKNTLLWKFKSHIDDKLNSAKVNVIDSTKDSFTRSLSGKEILDELDISTDDYCRVSPKSKGKNLEHHLKRQPNYFFVNNYFQVGLKPWLTTWTYKLNSNR